MTSKGPETEEEANQECCMCGDRGFCDQLFQCKICQFRYQHRYCSNVYPKANSYETCNMCLSHKVYHHHVKEKSPNSSNSLSSYYNKNNGGADNIDESKKGLRRASALQLQQQLEKPIKKQRLPEAISPSTSVAAHDNIATNEALAERMRRVKSVDINGVKKQVYRNKVRRYKLLDELSC